MHPFSTTYSTAFNTSRLLIFAGFRCFGKQSLICSYCSFCSSTLLQYNLVGTLGSQPGVSSISYQSYNERSNWLTIPFLGYNVRKKTVGHPLVAALGLSRLSLEFLSPNRLNRQREKDGFQLQILYWGIERELLRFWFLCFRCERYAGAWLREQQPVAGQDR